MFKRKDKIKKNADNNNAVTDIQSLLSYDYNEERVLYKNDFSEGLGGWLVRKHNDGEEIVKAEITSEEAHSGSRCMKLSGRFEDWHGAYLDITEYIKETVPDYEVMAWVKLRKDADPCRVHLSLQTNMKMGGVLFPSYSLVEDYYVGNPNILSKYRLPINVAKNETHPWETQYPPGYTTEDGWLLLRGKIHVRKSHFDSVFIYIETSEGETATQDIYVDDFVLLSVE